MTSVTNPLVDDDSSVTCSFFLQLSHFYWDCGLLSSIQETMELNATENSPDGRTNGRNVLQIEQEDPRILATSYVIYKVGKSEQLSSCQLFLKNWRILVVF